MIAVRDLAKTIIVHRRDWEIILTIMKIFLGVRDLIADVRSLYVPYIKIVSEYVSSVLKKKVVY